MCCDESSNMLVNKQMLIKSYYCIHAAISELTFMLGGV